MAKKKKVVFRGMKGERIEVELDEDAISHHNKTINVKSNAWIEKNFSDINPAYDDGYEPPDDANSLTPWLQDTKKSTDPDVDSDPN